jgi:hypothetical protein
MAAGQEGEFGAGRRARAVNNHAPRRRAMHALLLAPLLLARPALAQDGNPLVQRDVPAEATAENAVVARERALASGQRIAFERMATALGLPREATDRQIEAMVASLVIESERITPRGYSARITVNFRRPGETGTAAPGGAATRPGGAAVASIEAVARHGSLGEFAELSRRLKTAPAVARAELLGVSGEAARWRLALRSPPAEAAAQLAESGVALAPGEARAGEEWRLGLGSR